MFTRPISMKSNSTKRLPTRSPNDGFIALIAVIMLAFGALAFSFATLASAVSYADMISRRELRIQTRLNAAACLDTVKLMFAKDFFLNGKVSIPEFGCVAQVSNDFAGSISVNVTTTLEGVFAYQSLP